MDNGSVTTTSSAGIDTHGEVRFAGKKVFTCSTDIFTKCWNGRKKNQKYKTFLSDPTLLGTIKNWKDKSYKNKDFILKDVTTGSMFVAN